MHVLWIATKVPVPPVDGGRLVQKLTLEALAQRGVRVTLLAPVFPGEDPVRLHREAAAFCTPLLVPVEGSGPVATARQILASALPGMSALPVALARHAHRSLRHRAGELVASGRFSVVHAEQLQALPQAEAALARGLPVVLRAQNVESDLWRAAAERVAWPARAAARREARRLAQWEGRAVARVGRVVALTEPDARRLEDLAAAGGEGRAVGSRVTVTTAPFPESLPSGQESLPGDPAVVVLGSGGWLPNRDSVAWMMAEIWPAVRRRLPGSLLHLFGEDGPGHRTVGGGGLATRVAGSIVCHPALEDSAVAFAPGSVLAVPLRIASGVRMKILEAWSRGVPVVTTPEAASGLAARSGRELLVASSPEGFAAAIERLRRDTDLRHRLVSLGRRCLATYHSPARSAERLEAVYREVATPSGASHCGRIRFIPEMSVPVSPEGSPDTDVTGRPIPQ